MPYVALAAGIALSVCHPAIAGTWRLKGGQQWESVSSDPEEQYLHAIAELKELVQAGQSKAAKALAAQLRAEFPDRVGPDINLFVAGELHYWRNRYSKALVQYEKLLKNYPASQFARLVQDREFEIAQAYLAGRKITVLGFIRISGYSEGVELMEKISDRAGLDEPNGVGVNAAIAVAEHYERREQYLEAYLKWSEINSYWDTGPIGKKAVYRMAEDNFAAYNQHPASKRDKFDASKLTTAKAYYEKFLALYRQEALAEDVPEKIKEIDELMAYKQYRIGLYYRHIREYRAANLYFDMVVQNWPKTEAAEMAKQALAEGRGGEHTRGK